MFNNANKLIIIFQAIEKFCDILYTTFVILIVSEKYLYR